MERFMAALTTGDRQGLLDVLAPDAVMVADGGGLVPAARKPIAGADKLVAFLVAGSTRLAAALASTQVWLNGAPGARIDIDGEVAAAVSLTVEIGRITRIYAIVNPHKLARLGEEVWLSRAY